MKIRIIQLKHTPWGFYSKKLHDSVKIIIAKCPEENDKGSVSVGMEFFTSNFQCQ